MVIRVAVIGAGAAGLCALRHLKSRPEEFDAVAFERSSVIGGVWVYSESATDEDGRPLPTVLYKSLRTNLPKEAMAFPDFPFSQNNLPSFIGHEDMRRYFEDYARHFDVLGLIQFNAFVENVSPFDDDDGRQKWNVKVRDLLTPETNATSESVFDAVMVCNGHYTVPLMPPIPDMSEFKGEVSHSHSYRTPEAYKGKRVLVVGARASGVDLALELTSVASQVYLCHRNMKSTKDEMYSGLPATVVQCFGITRMTRDSAFLDDGRTLAVDVVLFCTGYRYAYPFLSPECRCEVTADGQRVLSLYRHLVHTRFTTLSFVGITKRVVPCPAFHCQVLYVLAVLTGATSLPSEAEMEDDTRCDYERRLSRGLPPSMAHVMHDLQWEYNDDLLRSAGLEPAPSVVRKLYDVSVGAVHKNVLTYRENNFKVIDLDNFVRL